MRVRYFNSESTQNPNMIFWLTVGFHSHFTDEAYPPGSDFWLRDENGEIIRRDTGSPNINFLNPEVQDLLAKRIIAAGALWYLRWCYDRPIC